MCTRAAQLRILSLSALLASAAFATSAPIKSSASEPFQPVQSGLAFAGADGYGKNAIGGRNGAIIFVTTLADRGPGSLRACIDASGPRVCIFRVGGIIRFTTTRPIIRNPYLTIAGQTAPGGGILLTHNGGADGLTPLVVKGTHDIIIRDIRVRSDMRGNNRGSNSGYVIQDSRNVIIDHVSGSWALDENMGLTGQNDMVTISWSIFAEGIPPHDKCALLGNNPKGPQHLSFINNLCAHNGDRNPDINFAPNSCVDVVNNVLYDAQSEYAEVWDEYGGTPVNIVGNYFEAGPSTRKNAPGIIRHMNIKKRNYVSGPARIYSVGNYFGKKLLPQSEGVAEVLQAMPVCPILSRVASVADAYRQVLEEAGAFPRDTLDTRIVQDVKNRSGSIVRTAGELPPIAGASPYLDDDGDGMSDDWERSHGANPKLFDAWVNRDGRSNLELFLDHAHAQLLVGEVSK